MVAGTHGDWECLLCWLDGIAGLPGDFGSLVPWSSPSIRLRWITDLRLTWYGQQELTASRDDGLPSSQSKQSHGPGSLSAMGNAVLTTSVGSIYDDLPEFRYHFPRTYLNQVQAAVGDWIVYYEPRRSHGGGRQAYFAMACVIRVAYQIEMLPPDSGQSSYGYRSAKPSRTVVRILGVNVAFELGEDYNTVRVPIPQPLRSRRPIAFQETPMPEYQNEGTGQLKFAITEPYARGIRVTWKDGIRIRIEDQLDAIMLSAVALAERARRDRLEQERLQKNAQEARALAAAKAAEELQLAQHLYDLDSRVQDCQRAEQIRSFLQKARLRLAGGAEQATPSAELKAWFDWAESLAEALESEALGTLLDYRKLPDPPPTSNSQGEMRALESGLQHQAGIWHRRFVYGRQ